MGGAAAGGNGAGTRPTTAGTETGTSSYTHSALFLCVFVIVLTPPLRTALERNNICVGLDPFIETRYEIGRREPRKHGLFVLKIFLLVAENLSCLV